MAQRGWVPASVTRDEPLLKLLMRDRVQLQIRAELNPCDPLLEIELQMVERTLRGYNRVAPLR